MKELLTLKEVASILKVSSMTLYRWIKAGKLPAYQVEKQYRIDRNDIDGFIKRNKVVLIK